MTRLCWPTLPPRFVADALAGHSAVALALGALIYLVCLTGTLCVFMDELQLWEAPAPPPIAFNPADSEHLIAAAIARAGGSSKAPVIFLRAPIHPHERTIIRIGEQQWTPTADGRLAPLALPWTDFLEDLHINLTLPSFWGEILVGLLGVALFSLLISGVLAHPRILRDAFVLRLGASRRLQEADLHNRMGVWGLPFHLAVTLTGALFGLASLLSLAVGATGHSGEATHAGQLSQAPKIAADPRPAPLPPLGQIVAQARSQRPGSSLYYFSVAAPYTKGAAVSVEVTAPGRLPRGEAFYFDQQGRQIGRTRFASGDLGLQLYSGAAEVHFGAFGGLPVRLIYGVLGWALTWICASGTSIWLARRRDNGRPAPRLEKAWSAWVWGAPTALAASTLMAPTVTFWTVLLIMLSGSQIRRPVAQTWVFDRICPIALTAALAITATVHWASAIQSGIALVVEGGVLILAGLTVSTLFSFVKT